MFSTLFVGYAQLCQTKIFLVFVSTRLVIFSDFKEIQIAIFSDLCFPHFLFDIPSSVRGLVIF